MGRLPCGGESVEVDRPQAGYYTIYEPALAVENRFQEDPDRDDWKLARRGSVATPLWGVFTFGAARSGRRTAPWLQRGQIYEPASSRRSRQEAIPFQWILRSP